MPSNILVPAATLVMWTLVMLAWMVATRGPVLAKLGADKERPGARGQDVDDLVEPRINWKAHNYAHLHEQPTIFYAAVFILVLSGYSATDVWLAWGYVALRVVHSLWQATVNRQPMRVILFLLSSLCLIGLGVRALLATLGG